MIKLLVIADDFTGALDTGVQFAVCGADIRVMTGHDTDFTAAPDCDVLVVDAETRHLARAEAYRIVERITLGAVEAKIPHIYKKTDSALRGNIGAELTALLNGSGEKMLPFLPSFPQIGRYTAGGIHYIKGVPVAESVFGDDPFEPVRYSAVAELIAEQSNVPVKNCPALADIPELPEKCIAVFDAATQEELDAVGKRLKVMGQLRIMAGCAGFAAVLPALLGLDKKAPGPLPLLDPRMLVICGSVNPITVEQLDEAEANGFIRIRLTPEQKLAPKYWESPQGQAEIGALYSIIKKEPYRIIETNDADGNQVTAELASTMGMGIQDIRQSVSQSVGYIVSRLFGCDDLGTLLITGGDTLLQCMDYMGGCELQPLCELDTGVVLSRFIHQGCTRYVISKSGGFGQKDLMGRIAEKLKETQNQNKEKMSCKGIRNELSLVSTIDYAIQMTASRKQGEA